jgi:uncharacterized protein
MPVQFDEVISDRWRLRELLPEYDGPFIEKEANYITALARRYIQASPFIVIATTGRGGRIDVSPRGDPPGFVEIADDRTLIIPDRPGNHRLDSFENLLTNPSIAIIFFIPGNTETLRVSGTAKVVRDAKIQSEHSINGRPPELALVVSVTEAFMHCSKAFVRSRMWAPDQWPDRTGVPSLAEWAADVSRSKETVADLQQRADDDARDRLY